MSGAGRAAVLTGAREPTWQDVPAAPPAPGTVTVEVRLCGICGTEVASYRTGSLHSPAVSGHEWVGTVAAVGDGVTSVAEGDRVVASVPGRAAAARRAWPGSPTPAGTASSSHAGATPWPRRTAASRRA